MNVGDTLFRTQVEVPSWTTPICPSDGLVFLGSCFAQQMGQRFQGYDLHTICNPLGVVYNPESIAIQIHQALHPGVAELPIFQTEGEWRCWTAGTMIGGATEQACTEVVQGALNLLGTFIQQADYLFITLGTNVCYRLKSSGLVVCNCHRMPQEQFAEEQLSLQQCIQSLSRLVEDVRSSNPRLRVVFTVSPYRYAKYGMHGSQLAKATLLLAVDEVCRLYPDAVLYFPAYEIVMDELRDYRFYEDDMIHPSHVAVDYIWSQLVDHAMSQELKAYLREYEPVRRFFLHRPINPESSKYKELLSRMEQQRTDVKKKYNV